MKPTPAPHVLGDTPWERSDDAVRTIFSVPKEALAKAEERLKKARAKKQRNKKQARKKS